MGGEFTLEDREFPEFRQKVTDYLDEGLKEVADARSYLSEPMMWGVDKLFNKGAIDHTLSKNIKERVRNILILLPLIETYDFRMPSGWEGSRFGSHHDGSPRNNWLPGINLRRLILNLAAASDHNLDENIFYGLNSTEFKAFTRRVLVDSIGQKGNIKKFEKMDRDELSVAWTLTDEEDKLLQVKFFHDGYLKDSAKWFLDQRLPDKREPPPIYAFSLEKPLPEQIFVEDSSLNERLKDAHLPFYQKAMELVKDWYRKLGQDSGESGFPLEELIGDIIVDVLHNGNHHLSFRTISPDTFSGGHKIVGNGVTLRFGERMLPTFPNDKIIGKKTDSSEVEIIGITKDLFDENNQLVEQRGWKEMIQVHISAQTTGRLPPEAEIIRPSIVS
ncbi:hypothetical protein A2W14_02500 [Candidatus Gottesmanbacteria bacterium RBG_16_37_8]|uniref:Uncharacterized protein n=1 Tax=Candidatus Gottesmanbacteria bacterium RBG_16_37_8 TaxID=1798371 RepID=A0A1F5YPU0_9BACT|nr:MAG: hypothetical protein A2W14_02500 [Candidatus Gottesmanbacteria bacterium RBG_16_37_8]